jgi:hypothetical protein
VWDNIDRLGEEIEKSLDENSLSVLANELYILDD